MRRKQQRRERDNEYSDKDDGVGKAYHLMEYYFRIAVFINAVPFTYSKTKRRFSSNSRSLKFIIWFVLMLVGILAEWAQATYELVRAKEDPDVSRGEWALIYFLFVSWTFVASCHYNVLKKHYLIVNHMNQAVGQREWFGGSYTLPPSKDHSLVRAHMWSSCSQCFFQCLMVAAEGYKNQFLYSNVPVEYRSPLTAGLWAVWAYYRVMTNFLCGYFHYFAGVLQVQTCNQVLQLRSQSNISAGEKLRFYRMLQILCNRYSECYSGSFIPSITLFAVQNLILGVYGIVKFYDQMAPDLYANFPLMVTMMMLFTLTFYPKNATVYETTKDETQNALREAVSRKRNNIWGFNPLSRGGIVLTPRRSFGGGAGQVSDLKMAKCVARSYPAIGIPFGSLYKIKQTTVLNIFNFIICNTISTLITYP